MCLRTPLIVRQQNKEDFTELLNVLRLTNRRPPWQHVARLLDNLRRIEQKTLKHHLVLSSRAEEI
jgi:hypothetical protein